MKRHYLLLLASILFGGCSAKAPDHYYWGDYETLILTMYKKPGAAEPLKQIEVLTSDIQKAEGRSMPVPPGVFAHLGMLYAMIGDVNLAEAAFQKERELFPEAAPFIDGMMTRSMNSTEQNSNAQK